jgi:small subunit ribosomal protein S1
VSDVKRPKATFGDVMLGIPAGGQGAGKRDDGSPVTPRGADSDRKSPTVVVKRAGAVVETRHAADAGKPTAQPVVPVPVGPSVADDVAEGESFAEMFEKAAKDGALPQRKMPRVGEKVRAKVFQLGAEIAFVTIGRLEAMIELDELKDEEGILRLGVGDELDAHVVETGAKGVLLSRKLSKGTASMSMLVDAKNAGMPVEGIVLGVNKGGLEVAVGEIRAFCPMSQVDIRPGGKHDELVGQRLLFRVTEMKEKNVVLSRRAILEEENKSKAAELKKTLQVGKVLRGRIVNVQAFGAFADLGGIEGLIPVSEMSHLRVGHPNEVVQAGDEVEVEIIRMEDAEPNSPDKSKRKDRVTLSMRSRLEDPWKKAAEVFKEGSLAKGKVVRLQPFGAFIELQPGIDGLIHISAMSDRRIAHPRDVLKVGDEVEVKIEKLEIDDKDKRIGLRLVKDGVVVGEGMASSQAEVPAIPQQATAEKAPAKAVVKPKRGQIVIGKVDRVEPFGVFVEWDGNRGLIPAAETGTDRGTDLKRVYSLGQELKVEVIEIEGQKLKLSITAAQRSEERADLNAWKAEESKRSGGGKGFGTLADKLKGLALK